MELSAREIRYVALGCVYAYKRDEPYCQIPLPRPVRIGHANERVAMMSPIPPVVTLRRQMLMFLGRQVRFYELEGCRYLGTVDDLDCIANVCVCAHSSVPTVGVGTLDGQPLVVLPMKESEESKMARRRDFGDPS